MTRYRVRRLLTKVRCDFACKLEEMDLSIYPDLHYNTYLVIEDWEEDY